MFNWEYWSFNTVYLLIYPIWLFYCLRARSFFFFAAANPSIENGGFLNESKKNIHAILPPHLTPRTAFFSLPANGELVINQLRQQGFLFPLIGKPDVGAKGTAVKVLLNESEVIDFVHRATLDFHIQEYVAYKNEVGIFYYRYPGESSGRISGIVRKEFLSVTGDGKSSVLDLLMQQDRAILQLPKLEATIPDVLEYIPAEGERRVVVPYGNHARGAKFLDDTHLADSQLTASIDAICRQIDGFYYGRLDVRYQSWEDLRQGKNLYIIECNGAGSEPTHMYDPRHSLFFAWKEIIRHWKILWKISVQNRRRGHRYLSFREGMRMFRVNKLYNQKLAAMA